MKRNFLAAIFTIGTIFNTPIKSEETKPQDQATEQQANTAKVETIVNSVINNSPNKPNVQKTARNLATDLATMCAAACGFLISKKLLPKLSEQWPSAANSLGKVETPIAIIVAIVCLKGASYLFQTIFSALNWDPRDLAVADKLISTINTGATLTSDYQPLRNLLEQIMPEIEKGPLSLSRKAKIELSRRIRSCLQAFHKACKIKTKDQKVAA